MLYARGVGLGLDSCPLRAAVGLSGREITGTRTGLGEGLMGGTSGPHTAEPSVPRPGRAAGTAIRVLDLVEALGRRIESTLAMAGRLLASLAAAPARLLMRIPFVSRLVAALRHRTGRRDARGGLGVAARHDAGSEAAVPDRPPRTPTPEHRQPPPEDAEGGTQEPASGPPRDAGPPSTPAGPAVTPPYPWWRVSAAFLLTVLAAALLTVLRRVDSALQQMAVGDQAGGSALGFPVSYSPLGASLQYDKARDAVLGIRAGWAAYRDNVSGTQLRDPFDVAQSVVWLDAVFIVVYALLIALILITLHRINERVAVASTMEAQRLRRGKMLRWTPVALGALIVIDVIENIQLASALVSDGSTTPHLAQVFGLAIGPTASFLKIPLAVAVLLPPLFVAVALALSSRPLARALVSTRGVLGCLAVLAVLLMTGIGAAQVDDVVRAWDLQRGVFAWVAVLLTCVTVKGLIRRLTGGAVEHPAPDSGDPAQAFTLGAGVILIALGGALWLTPLRAGGLAVAGTLLILIWMLGVPLVGARTPTAAEAEAVRQRETLQAALTHAEAAKSHRDLAVDAVRRGATAEADMHAREAAVAADLAERTAEEALGDLRSAALATPGVDDAGLEDCSREAARLAAQAREAAAAARDALSLPQVADWGDRVARAAASGVALMIVVVIARATALDAYIRTDVGPSALVWPVFVAIAVTLTGCAVLLRRSTNPGDLPLRASAWAWSTLACVVVGGALLSDDLMVTAPQALGAVAVLLGGFTVLVGGFGVLASAIRQGPMSRYALAPALRLLRFRRFPVVLFLVAWALGVSALDRGGYHDIRRDAGRPDDIAPTIAQAWQEFAASAPTTSARPVVLIAAEGGGVRAAVWTALVMECLFGPGPVAGTETVCAQGSSTPDLNAMAQRVQQQPLPVFLASGASGGSVGLAAWSARRTDLLQDQAATRAPHRVEAALGADFVAPDVARLIMADLPHAFLGWDFPDRAEALERAWERPWGSPRVASTATTARGMSRGLRQMWDLTHEGSAWSTPVLALNGVSVEDGCRVVASAVDFTVPATFDPDSLSNDATNPATSADDRPDDAACRGPLPPATRPADQPGQKALDVLPSTSELIDYLCPNEDVPLSTAAHLSARFPYVSPSGRIVRSSACPAAGGLVPEAAVSYDADGGYFDNSGAGAVTDAWRALVPLAAQTEREAKARTSEACMVPMMIQIDNSPPAPTTATSVDPRPKELLVPPGATFGQIGSREAYARAGAASTFSRPISAGGQPVRLASTSTEPVSALWFRLSLFGQPGPEPPLGWTLSEQSVADMRSQLRARDNVDTITDIRRLLAPGALACGYSAR